MIHGRPGLSGFFAALFLVVAWPSFARADGANIRAALEPAQLEAFSALVGEPASTVAQRMVTDPSLAPLAARAADARLRRKHTGKVLTITGFTIFGVGTVIGFELAVSSLRPVNCPSNGCDTDRHPARAGLVVMVVSEAIGLALAIPGIVKMARQSEAENEASARYRSGSGSSWQPTQSLQVAMPESPIQPTGFLLPLLSGAF